MHRLRLTHHAVEQFISRFDRTLTKAEAWRQLEEQLPYADRLKERTVKGDTLWRLPNGALLVSRQAREGTHQIVVTVLRSAREEERLHPAMPTEEEMEMLLERGAAEAQRPGSMEGRVMFEVTVDYVLTVENETLVRERVRHTIERLLAGLTVTGLVQARIPRFSVKEISKP